MAISPLFNQLFSKSPVAPMQEHMKVAAQAATEVQGYMDAVIAGDWDKATQLGERINALEDEADELKRKIRLSLPRCRSHGLIFWSFCKRKIESRIWRNT